MAGRTLSAHVDEAVVSKVEDMARREDRKVGQIVNAAVRFYMSLSPEAQAALRAIEGKGSRDEHFKLMTDVSRLLVRSNFFVSQRLFSEATEHMRDPDATDESIETEADSILAEMDAEEREVAN